MTDLNAGTRLALVCPACSPDLETVHEVLSPGGHATVRCTECDHVHKTAIERERTVDRRVVVSQDDESFSAQTDVPRDERLAIGEEFVLDTEEALVEARITGLETIEGTRTEAARAADVRTIWARDVGNVAVDVTLHPHDGTHDESRSVSILVPGDYAFMIGQPESIDGEEFTVESVIVRDDTVGYDRDQLDERGDEVLAKDVKRLYGRDDTTARSAW
ncbi:HVO_0476 family zinc finger protein [Halovivax sp.]|uniref:HVO_0476 family zinc finger protein n=1 Tax=Halovivax sp. TaxID=1935978 RepID=UPI0025BCC97F|nr:HVO_0476 family zinc finger protein [Halovivax sp.]